MAKRSRQCREYIPQQLAGPLTRIAIPCRPRFRATASEFSLPPRISTGTEVSSAGLVISGSIAGLHRRACGSGIIAKNENSGPRREQVVEQDFSDARAFARLGDQVVMVESGGRIDFAETPAVRGKRLRDIRTQYVDAGKADAEVVDDTAAIVGVPKL